MKNGPSVANAASDKTIQHAKIRGVSIWFYIIAGLQLLSAYQAYQAGSDALAAAGATIAVVDLLIGAAFVVLGYFAGQRHPWAFVAGIVLYVIRTAVNLIQFFSPIALLIRLYLTYRIWQGLQACLAANRADQAMAMLNQRRLVMPTTSPATSFASSEPAAAAPAPAQPWRPAMQQSEPETP
ncbi:MAG TPA: hypothetical protein VFO25_04115 [Candidatus Eremiobacteraceae bacterium]|nr:hypothetical protein [Candidatus Eremiobacteraceae bacterium]